MKTIISLLTLCAFCGGCAVNRPSITETTTATNGVTTTRSLKVTTFALWPATTSLEKQRVTLGRTFAVGMEGLREDGGGTNVVEALKSLDSILGKIR